MLHANGPTCKCSNQMLTLREFPNSRCTQLINCYKRFRQAPNLHHKFPTWFWGEYFVIESQGPKSICNENVLYLSIFPPNIITKVLIHTQIRTCNLRSEVQYANCYTTGSCEDEEQNIRNCISCKMWKSIEMVFFIISNFIQIEITINVSDCAK